MIYLRQHYVINAEVLFKLTYTPEETSYNYGDTIMYTCVEGYEKTIGGPLVRNCTDTNTWSGAAPICES